jgi:hypothetical protein
MEMKKYFTRLSAAILGAVVLAFIYCASTDYIAKMKEDLAVLGEINESTLVRPAPADTLVLIKYSGSGVTKETVEGELPRIPVPPDRLYGYSAIYCFSSASFDSIEVLKSSVTPEGQVKIFQKMKPNEEYILIRYIKKKSAAGKDSTMK